MELWQLYLIITIPGIGGFLWVSSFILGIAALCCGVGTMINFCLSKESFYDEKEIAQYVSYSKAFLKGFKRLGIIFLVCAVGTILIPSKTDLYWLVGGYYVTNLQGVKDLPPNVVNAMNKFLEDYVPKEQENAR